MQRYAAFLRGVTPMNCKMAELKRALEKAGFEDVRTVLSSGNAVFGARKATDAALAKKCEAAMQAHLGRTFGTIVRSIEALDALLASDPYAAFRLPANAKRVVTFLRAAPAGLKLPVEQDGARILRVVGGEAFSAYVPSPRGPVFMTLIARTLGDDVTTRTWDTVGKVRDIGSR